MLWRFLLILLAHIPHPFFWGSEGFSRNALKPNLTQPYTTLAGPGSLSLPDVITPYRPELVCEPLQAGGHFAIFPRLRPSQPLSPLESNCSTFGPSSCQH